MDSGQPTKQSVLHHPAYLHLAASRVLTALASQAVTIAVSWIIYDMTESAFALGFVGFCQFLPRFFLTLVVGHVADSFDRRMIVLICQLAQAAIAAMLAVAIFEQWITPTLIFVAVTLLGAVNAFQQPSTVALLPNVVPPSLLQQAVATSTSLQQAAFIIGPAAGGLLYGVHPTAPFVISAVLLLVGGVNVALIHVERRVVVREPVTIASVFAGVAFIRSRPVILGAISLDLFAVLLGGATALMPIFARDILHAGPWGLGFLRAAPAIGALGMALLLARRPLKTHVGRRMMVACAVFGVATIVFSLSTNIVLSIVCLAILGAADTISVVVRSSMVQLMTPDEMRGRVSAVNSLFIGTSNQLGEFESGVLAGFLGPVATGVIGGVGTLIVVLLWIRLFPELVRVKTLEG
ncbi:MFS transporter [Neorhizobium galegae]|uniref:MFS transporter n=1 Tax=Neorhizobium galegae TaxID=399 RepID=UPI00210440EE|nr:MFS transporter [Neorhizobium galegae]MCQ1855634.1 MFS transporter [Neorhizobium galegae]